MARILVVDDEEQICNMLKNFLTMEGYEVYTVLNGEEALSAVKERKPHVVLLDIKMPGMDGIECLKCIKEIDKEVTVIMITGIIQEEISEQAMKFGAYDYITKPLSLSYLRNSLMMKLCL